MKDHIIHLDSIGQLHKTLGHTKPQHPMISIIDAADVVISPDMLNTKMTADFYYVSLKDRSCGIKYGRNTYDFDEGVLIFTAPRQVITITREMKMGESNGWMLFFHPDLIRDTHLDQEINNYSFFGYDVHEALHLSGKEEQTLNQCVNDIRAEYRQRIDQHSKGVITAGLSLLFKHCLRFYERQFHTRSGANKDFITQFEYDLKQYFNSSLPSTEGMPSINYFAAKAHLSPHYFSDLLKKETGRSAKDHINDYVVERAKGLLLRTEHSVGEIAYHLGFNYPHYFTRLFKARTGYTPAAYRTSN